MRRGKAVDAAIIERVLRGDRGAFTELVKQHHAALHAVCVAIVGSSVEADDVVQATWLNVHRSLATFRADASLRTWLVRIAIREAVLCKRRRRIMDRYEDEELASPIDLERNLQRGQVAALLVHELARLPAKTRRILILRDVLELSTAETGRQIGLEISAVKVRLHRARKQLAERISAREPCREFL